jgi:hypothetical protein
MSQFWKFTPFDPDPNRSDIMVEQMGDEQGELIFFYVVLPP